MSQEDKPKDVWYDGCLIIQLDVDSSGVRRLLTEDLQPRIEFKLLVPLFRRSHD